MIINRETKISVLAVSYNHEKYIADCINSVFGVFSSSYDIEMIVIDDGSSDHTCEIVERLIYDKSLNITLVKSEHKGIDFLNARINEGIKLCRGEYIMLIASDDGFLENRFNEHIPRMINNKSLAVCISPGVNVRENGRKTLAIGKKTRSALLSYEPDIILNHLTNNIPELYLQGMTFSGDFLRNNLFLNESVLADDWQFNILIFKLIKSMKLQFMYIDIPVFYRNIHNTNTSLNFPVHYKRISEMAKIHARRPRLIILRFVFRSLLIALAKLDIKRVLGILGFLLTNKSPF